jgi:CheY-like chemotaxis protein
VYGIVKQSGGDIAVESEAGRGTMFRIYLPSTEEVQAAATTPARREAPPGSELVLLVEDEPEVRALATEYLERAGYTVLGAGHPADALALAQGSRAPIDVVVTDVVMPGMTGRVLVERLRAARPDIAVLYMSGYTDGTTDHEGLLEPTTVFLPKPFTAQLLLAKVREALAAAHTD